MLKKHLNLRLLIFAIIVSLGWTLLSYFIITSRVSTLTNEKYLETSNEMKDFLEIFINEKQEAVSLISLTLAHNSNIKEALIQKNGDTLVLHNFTQRLKKNTMLQNVWIQVIKSDGKSFYRSWTNKKGDDLSKVRLDIAKIIKSPKIINSISVKPFWAWLMFIFFMVDLCVCRLSTLDGPGPMEPCPTPGLMSLSRRMHLSCQLREASLKVCKFVSLP